MPNKSVSFSTANSCRYYNNYLKPRIKKSTLTMNKKLFEHFGGSQVTDKMLLDASILFGSNYGIWGDLAPEKMGSFAKPGKHVRLSPDRLRAQCLPDGADCSYIRVTVDGDLAGNAFTCRWEFDGKTVCWITQLVVHQKYRERGLASGLLLECRRENDTIFGIMSSHAAACLALAKVSSLEINAVRLGYMSEFASEIMGLSPIEYIKDAKLAGKLFNQDDHSGAIASVDTGFFVDHQEPLDALNNVREFLDWPLGDLLDGHEFLLILEVRRRTRSRSLSDRSQSETPKSEMNENQEVCTT